MGPCGAKLSENVKSWLAKGFAVAYGIISFAVVFIVKYLPGVLQVNISLKVFKSFLARPQALLFFSRTVHGYLSHILQMLEQVLYLTNAILCTLMKR